ncbi:putative Alpha/beta-Hydrolases superfamily protein [Quillaja saponaria]|uniref:Alpha/beta-Hydrolases superfamily protein n=1 Tax=Quillaja saponaria TaxID=32244 RepID=A0AAD7PRU5_QUISA|nr:putative Alpha/beta-Hydrolases superfamily protein [Quillaja saponaria]
MGSVDLVMNHERVQVDQEDGGSKLKELDEMRNNGGGNMRRRKKSKKRSYMPRFGCFRTEPDGVDTNFDMEVIDGFGNRLDGTHLVIMVNGLIGSAQNWKFAAKQFLRKYPKDVIAHCSECNSAMLTFDGVDVMGERLAEEVLAVIKRHQGLQKISFVGHSLGGLVARYAIARLYVHDVSKDLPQENGQCENGGSLKEKYEGKIAGLEPINFITFATPHLGSRGHKQIPVFCGFYTLEKVASRSSWFLGRTGKHLFLTDSDDGKPPLLLQMVRDCEDLKFLSALQSFRRRVAYANVRHDHLVGWSTSSIRRRNELPKRQQLSRHERYPHIVNVESAKVPFVQVEVPDEAGVSACKTINIEEEMIRGLTKVSWGRIDVSFSGSKQKYLAHSTIQVKTYCINSDGADVVQHMVDNFLS